MFAILKRFYNKSQIWFILPQIGWAFIKSSVHTGSVRWRHIKFKLKCYQFRHMLWPWQYRQYFTHKKKERKCRQLKARGEKNNFSSVLIRQPFFTEISSQAKTSVKWFIGKNENYCFFLFFFFELDIFPLDLIGVSEDTQAETF